MKTIEEQKIAELEESLKYKCRACESVDGKEALKIIHQLQEQNQSLQNKIDRLEDSVMEFGNDDIRAIIDEQLHGKPEIIF